MVLLLWLRHLLVTLLTAIVFKTINSVLKNVYTFSLLSQKITGQTDQLL